MSIHEEQVLVGAIFTGLFLAMIILCMVVAVFEEEQENNDQF